MNNCAMFSSHKNSFFKLLQAWMLAWVKFCNDKIKLSIIFYIYILILILIIIHLLQSIFSMLGSSPLNHLTISWTNEQVILLINPFLPLIFVVKVYLLFLQITWMSEQTILLIDFFLSSMLLLKKTGSNRFFIVSWKFCSAAWKFPQFDIKQNIALHFFNHLLRSAILNLLQAVLKQYIFEHLTQFFISQNNFLYYFLHLTTPYDYYLNQPFCCVSISSCGNLQQPVQGIHQMLKEIKIRSKTRRKHFGDLSALILTLFQLPFLILFILKMNLSIYIFVLNFIICGIITILTLDQISASSYKFSLFQIYQSQQNCVQIFIIAVCSSIYLFKLSYSLLISKQSFYFCSIFNIFHLIIFLFSFLTFEILMSNHSSQQSSQRGNEFGFIEEKLKLRFEIISKIGSGAYGHVWKVRCKQTRQIFAIKKVFLAFQNDTDAQRVYRQINLLQKIRHDNVVSLKEVISADNKNDIYLLFEFMESDVFKAVKNRVLDQMHKKFIVYQLACGLKYLHSAGILHRDLKPSNILISSNCNVKICDFGLSRTLKSEFFNNPIMTQFIATRWYRAPEVLLGSKCYTCQSDMWSLGCLIYELYSRRTLLPGQNTIDQITKIIEFKGKPTVKQIQSFKAARAQEILAFFQVEQQNQEYYFADLQTQEVRQILRKLLVYDPNKRWTAEDVLSCEFLKQFRHSLPERPAQTQIMLQLNDNRKYKVDRYKSQILNLADQTKPKQSRSSTKRLLFSLRNSQNSYSLHSFAKKIKPQLHTTLRDKYKNNKKYQSAHISPTKTPTVKESIEKSNGSSKDKMIRAPARLSSTLHRRNKTNDEFVSKDKFQKSKEKQGSFIRKSSPNKTNSKINVKGVKQQKGNKQNYENRLKQLKKQKLKFYRNDQQA